MCSNIQERNDKIIKLYNDGIDIKSIALQLNISEKLIVKKLRHNLSDNDIKQIISHYLNDEFDSIYKKYPFLNKTEVYRITSKYHVKKDKYFWSIEEINILTSNYNKLTLDELYLLLNKRHNKRAISTKAMRLNLTVHKQWTKEENDVLLKNYSILPIDDVMNMLPGRTYNSIVSHAIILGIKSNHYLQSQYTNEDCEFIINNSGILTDNEIAQRLNKSLSGIQDKRRKLNIYYLNKTYSNYSNFNKFFRGHIQSWKNESIKKCNYKCIITGDKNFQIHHLYSMNKIVEETLNELDKQGLLKGDNLSDYTYDELNNILSIFEQIHNSYPLGVCIRSDIHELFHSIYGSGGNTPEQWNYFISNYKLEKLVM